VRWRGGASGNEAASRGVVVAERRGIRGGCRLRPYRFRPGRAGRRGTVYGLDWRVCSLATRA